MPRELKSILHRMRLNLFKKKVSQSKETNTITLAGRYGKNNIGSLGRAESWVTLP